MANEITRTNAIQMIRMIRISVRWHIAFLPLWVCTN